MAYKGMAIKPFDSLLLTISTHIWPQLEDEIMELQWPGPSYPWFQAFPVLCVLIVHGRITVKMGKAWAQTSHGVDAGVDTGRPEDIMLEYLYS